MSLFGQISRQVTVNSQSYQLFNPIISRIGKGNSMKRITSSISSPAKSSYVQQKSLYSSHSLFSSSSSLSSSCSSEKSSRVARAPSTQQRRISTVTLTPRTALPDFAFVIDIDGVLIRSSVQLKAASRGLYLLHANNIPFILLTNGGGKPDCDRVDELCEILGIRLTEEKVVQCHTPFKQLVQESDTEKSLKDKTVLVIGGDGNKSRKAAEMYGFTEVVTTGDMLMAEPTVWPFNQIFTDYYRRSTRPLPRLVDLTNLSQSLKFDAIMVFDDPRDWALDTQIVLDLLLSEKGFYGTYSTKNGDTSLPNNGWQQDGQPKLFFSNPDLFWPTDCYLPRLGQGAFQAAFDGVWKAVTGGAKLERTVIGKPHAETFQYAERVLRNHRAHLLGTTPSQTKREIPPLRRVFMVGDNPESDIRGANEYKSPHGTDWTSVLVQTGVYRKGTVPAYKPKVILSDIEDAVLWAFEEQGWDYNPW